MLRVIAYDIRDDRRRRRIASLCRDYGVRTQYSVFMCDLSDENWQAFLQRMRAVIDEREDGVLVLPLCRSCRAAQIVLGRGQLYEKPRFYLF